LAGTSGTCFHRVKPAPPSRGRGNQESGFTGKRIAHQLGYFQTDKPMDGGRRETFTPPIHRMSQWPSCTPITPTGLEDARNSRHSVFHEAWLEPTIQRPVGARLEIARPDPTRESDRASRPSRLAVVPLLPHAVTVRTLSTSRGSEGRISSGHRGLRRLSSARKKRPLIRRLQLRAAACAGFPHSAARCWAPVSPERWLRAPHEGSPEGIPRAGRCQQVHVAPSVCR